MRFQSIPDHFEVVFGSQDERNAFIGNAVPPLLARAIAMSVKDTFNAAPERKEIEGTAVQLTL
jgi:DNA (cytosine-5)-methyltransferase 1